jgi:hypothetical protein
MPAARRALGFAVLPLLLLLVVAPPLGAQHLCPPGPPGIGEEPCPLDAPRWTGELAVLGANAVLGGVTAGLAQRLAGGSFRDGFTRGFVGGSVVYAGKRVAVERFGGAGLLGRELAAVGTSIVDNAAAGRGTLEQLVLPVFIGRVYIDTGIGSARPPRLTPRLDALATFWTAYGFIESELSFDTRATLSSGTPVFRTDNREMVLGGDSAHAAGLALAGVIYLAEIPAWGRAWRERAFAHERVHALQMDQIFLKWTRPAERALIERLPRAGGVLRFVDLNLSSELLRGLALLFPDHIDRPWELEAFYLAR